MLGGRAQACAGAVGPTGVGCGAGGFEGGKIQRRVAFREGGVFRGGICRGN